MKYFASHTSKEDHTLRIQIPPTFLIIIRFNLKSSKKSWQRYLNHRSIGQLSQLQDNVLCS